MKILYYDCFAGISGDMNLGALLDLGVDFDYLKSELQKLPVNGYEISVESGVRKGISGTRVNVNIDGHHDFSREHNIHPHHHYHSIGKQGMHEPHPHRSYKNIKDIIMTSNLSEQIKIMSLNIFGKIADAEAKIHNTPLDEVSFHEVGAVDSIVDIVGAAICLNKLNPEYILCSSVELGGGFVNCSHGLYPVPAPATTEILKNVPVHRGRVEYEATTPTGAAILSSCVNEFSNDLSFKIDKVGYGLGLRDGPIPNVVRVFSGEREIDPIPEADSYYCIECNIDDMNPEFYDYIFDRLYLAGAQDVHMTQIIMKKMRPSVKLSVICLSEKESAIVDVLFNETSTIGVRKIKFEKSKLEIKTDYLQTKYGIIKVKSAFNKGILIKSKPEIRDCQKIALEKNLPLIQIYKEIEIEVLNALK